MGETRTLRAGVVGLGMLGGAVAERLVHRGHIPAVYDSRPDAADGLAGVPRPLGSPAAVARASDVVMVAVATAPHARDVITGADGLLAGAHPDLILVLLSTVALPVVQDLADRCTSTQVGFLDCGVIPGTIDAMPGMVAILGGGDAVVERARPVLDQWARKIVHGGPLGAGMATKLAHDVVIYGSWRSMAEASALVEAAGVPPATLAEVMEASDPEGATLRHLFRLRGPSNAGPEAVARQMAPLMMQQDLEAAHELSAFLGVATPLLEVVRAHADQTLSVNQKPAAAPGNAWERGLDMLERVYGPGFSRSLPTDGPFFELTVQHLFADIWSRPGLSIRDRRLLVLGVSAALGRADVIQRQVQGALANHELTVAQLQEVVLHLAYYAGWENARAAQQGIIAAVASVASGGKEQEQGARPARPGAWARPSVSSSALAPALKPLTRRERKVLRLLAAGLSNPEIAAELVVSLSTVKTQVSSIYRKLDVNTRKAAIVTARSWNLL